jgi:hypothetical protein
MRLLTFSSQVGVSYQSTHNALSHERGFTLGRDTVRHQRPALSNYLTILNQTASLLTSIIYCLSQHPDIAEKLRKEIIDKVGLIKSPTYEDIKDMKYTRAILNGKPISDGLYIVGSNIP